MSLEENDSTPSLTSYVCLLCVILIVYEWIAGQTVSLLEERSRLLLHLLLRILLLLLLFFLGNSLPLSLLRRQCLGFLVLLVKEQEEQEFLYARSNIFLKGDRESVTQIQYNTV